MSHIVRRRAQEQPDELALVDRDRALTWREFADQLNRAVNAFSVIDLGEARRLAVFAENSIEAALAHLAGQLAGISTVPVSMHFTADEVAYVLRDSGAPLVCVGPETAERGVEAAQLAEVPLVVGWRSAGVAGVASFEALLAAASPAPFANDRPPRAHLHYTSGTTGFPKGTESPPTMFQGGATVEEFVERVAKGPQVDPDGAVLLVSPMYHTSALSTIRYALAGMTVVILGRFDAESVLRAVERYHVTVTTLVPTHFQRLLALPEETRARYDLSSLRQIAHTGAACPVPVKRAMIEWVGPILFDAYGSTESGVTNAITSEEWLAHPGSIGKTVPPFELVIVDDDGTPLGAYEEGRLFFRDTTGRGITYHNRPDATAAAHLEAGVFTLGEIGYVDDDGYVYLTDRASDMIVSGGVNIYPAEAERVLLDHPGVADVACIGVPDDDMGEQLKALVIPTDPSKPPPARELLAFCRDRIAHYKAPRSVDFVVDIGRNAMGKVNKRVLRAPFWPTGRTIGGVEQNPSTEEAR